MSPPIPITPTRLKQWVEQAQPNARLVYGTGMRLAEACSIPVKELVLDLYEKGWLTPHYQKAAGGEPARHLVQRTQRPFLKGTVL